MWATSGAGLPGRRRKSAPGIGQAKSKSTAPGRRFAFAPTGIAIRLLDPSGMVISIGWAMIGRHATPGPEAEKPGSSGMPRGARAPTRTKPTKSPGSARYFQQGRDLPVEDETDSHSRTLAPHPLGSEVCAGRLCPELLRPGVGPGPPGAIQRSELSRPYPKRISVGGCRWADSSRSLSPGSGSAPGWPPHLASATTRQLKRCCSGWPSRCGTAPS